MLRAVVRKVVLSNFDQKKPQLKTEVHSLPCEEGVENGAEGGGEEGGTLKF